MIRTKKFVTTRTLAPEPRPALSWVAVLLWAGACAALLIACVTVSPIGDIVRFVVNLFAPGRSMVKVVLLLAYAPLLFVVARVHMVRALRSNTAKRVGRVLYGVIAGSLVLNFASFIWFIRRLGFEWSDYIYTYNNGEISLSQIFHNHVMKGSIGIVARAFGGGQYATIDAGTAYVGLMPTWLLVVQAMLFAAIVILVLRYFILSVPAFKKTATHEVAAYTLFYALTTLALMRVVLDGGLLDRITLPALFFLIVLVEGGGRKMFVRMGIVCIAYMGFVGTMFMLRNALLWETSSKLYVVYTLSAISILAYLYHTFAAGRTLVRGRIMNTALLAASIVMVFASLYYQRHFFFYTQKVIAERGAFITTKNVPPENSKYARYEYISTLGDLHFYKAIPKAGAGTVKVNHIAEDIDTPANFFPVYVPWYNCKPLGGDTVYRFTLVADTPFDPEPYRFPVRVREVVPEGFHNGLYRYDVTLALDQCMPQQYDIFEEFMQAQGLTSFSISNVVSRRNIR